MAVAEGAQTSDGPRTVLVARALVGVFETTAVVTELLIIGLPVLMLVVRHDVVGRGRRGARSRRFAARWTRSRPPSSTAGCRSPRPTTRSAGWPRP